MPVSVREKFQSRESTTGESAQVDLAYIVEGTDDDITAKSSLLAATPSLYDGLVRQSAHIEPVGPGLWDGLVRYGRPENQEPETGESSFSFDTGGGTQHITQSLATVRRYAASGTAPDFKGAIGVTHDNVEGVDITVPVYNFSETHYLSASKVNQTYKATLFQLTGKVNSGAFRGLSAGECRARTDGWQYAASADQHENQRYIHTNHRRITAIVIASSRHERYYEMIMSDKQSVYEQRLKRYTTALKNGKADCVPIRPFVAEFVARYAGYTCQQVTQDFNLAFEATVKTCADFDWDAAVANMVYVWGGIAQAMGLRYYAIPGVGLSPNTGFQFLEPPENQSWMQADEYDRLIADPTRFCYEVWLPRVSTQISAEGEPSTYREKVALVKGGMAMMHYFGSFPAQIQRMREQAAMPSAIAGILKAPLDIIADKFRGYLGLCEDLMEQPEKVKKAAEALMPHMYQVALSSSDPSGALPIGFWMHRGCVPLVSRDTFETIFWPTVKPIILELHKRGRQVLFYAEGKWAYHLKTFLELPEGSIIYHCDRDDIVEVHRVLHHKFAISGGIDNALLAFGKPQQVRERVKQVIHDVGRDGGFILDAGAIIQNDATVENMQAMTQAARDFGQY